MGTLLKFRCFNLDSKAFVQVYKCVKGSNRNLSCKLIYEPFCCLYILTIFDGLYFKEKHGIILIALEKHFDIFLNY